MLTNLTMPKTKHTVLPSYEDSIILSSFVLTQYWHVTAGQTEIQPTKHITLWRTVKMYVN